MAYAEASELAAALRIKLTAENTDRLEACLAAASEEIDHELDRREPMPAPVPEAIHATAIVRGVEWYKAADAAFGVIGTTETGTLTAPRDSFDRHRAVIVPEKQQWGIA